MDYTFEESIPSEETYNELREKAGWNRLDSITVSRSLPGSLYCICAKYNEKTIAFARVVGDGGVCFYIQEIIVDPDHQRQGIATAFMTYILDYLKRSATRRSYIGVFAGKGLEAFYEKYGFWKRPTTRMGHGMMQFWNDADFNSRYKTD